MARPRADDTPVAVAGGLSHRQGAFAAAVIFLVGRAVIALTARTVVWFNNDFTIARLLSAWDGGWYLLIADQGYPSSLVLENNGYGSRWAFFPALPVLTRVVHEITGTSLPISGLIVTWSAGTAAAIVIWKLVRVPLGDDTALLTVGFVSFFPAAYVLGMVYTESLFLLTAALCLLGLQRGNWIMAGLSASAGCLVRTNGVVLTGLVIVVAAVTIRRERSLVPIVGALTSLIGFVSWTLFQAIHGGSATISVDAQRIWGQHFVWFRIPFEAAWRLATDRAAWGVPPNLMAAGALLFAAAALVTAIWYARRHPNTVPLEWWLYSAGMLVLVFAPFVGVSMLRFAVFLFPLYAIAIAAIPRWLAMSIIAANAVVMGTFAFATLHGFAAWEPPFHP